VTGEAERLEAFITTHTRLSTAPLVPEIALFLATEITPIWQASETWLATHDLPPPYWAFAWPGGQALARYVLDHPGFVAGKRVLDFAAGCGLAGIAAAKSGAARVVAAEIDAVAKAAIRLNAAQNHVTVEVVAGDVVGRPAEAWDLILCGDVCYEAPMTRHILPWLRVASTHAQVWIADPGRAYVPKQGLLWHAAYDVPTTLELEDRISCKVDLFQLEPGD
jgi:predicted nicotinamide N-methyase